MDGEPLVRFVAAVALREAGYEVAQTALSKLRSTMEQRVCRWLLLAHDRVDGDELALTHEFLATMLGVQRSGATLAVQELERKGLIGHRRGVVIIQDREGLKQNSNGTYTGCL
jgi:CRP-like cAMP-binding protein